MVSLALSLSLIFFFSLSVFRVRSRYAVCRMVLHVCVDGVFMLTTTQSYACVLISFSVFLLLFYYTLFIMIFFSFYFRLIFFISFSYREIAFFFCFSSLFTTHSCARSFALVGPFCSIVRVSVCVWFVSFVLCFFIFLLRCFLVVVDSKRWLMTTITAIRLSIHR